jgi:telomere length regulation protein
MITRDGSSFEGKDQLTLYKLLTRKDHLFFKSHDETFDLILGTIMDGLLTAVQTKRIEVLSESAVQSVDTLDQEAPSIKDITNEGKTPEALLQLLQEQPSEQELHQILKSLDPLRAGNGGTSFDIRLPSPLHGQILHTLVNKTIPDHWSNVEKRNLKIRGALLRCFSSVVGLRALVGYIQISNNAIRSMSVKERESGKILALRDVLSFASTLLKPKDFISRVYHDNSVTYDTDTKRRVAWSEFCSLLSGGKILSTAAEALTVIKDSEESHKKSWIGEGHAFAEWLGKNMSSMIVQGNHEDEDLWKSTALMVGRATGLGYTAYYVHELYTGLIVDGSISPSWGVCFEYLRHHERSAILQSILKNIQKRQFATDDKNIQTTSSTVGGVAALLNEILKDTASPQETLRSWLSNASTNVVTTFGLRRALLLLVAKDRGLSIRHYIRYISNVS